MYTIKYQPQGTGNDMEHSAPLDEDVADIRMKPMWDAIRFIDYPPFSLGPSELFLIKIL